MRCRSGKDKLGHGGGERALKVWIDLRARSNTPDTLVPAPPDDRSARSPTPTASSGRFVRSLRPCRARGPGQIPECVIPSTPLSWPHWKRRGWTLSAEADRRTLLRRASYTLIGLPPTPAEIEAFVNDPSADAFEKNVDRLLASPRYGERWARHWLDLAGYADSEGILDADYPRTAAWRYRDYVIRAFNADKPYDRFLKEQIAGDELTDYWTMHQTRKELPAEVVEGLIATGYLRCASDTSRPDFANIKNAPGYYYQTLDDTVKIVASGVLGLDWSARLLPQSQVRPDSAVGGSSSWQAIFMRAAYRPSQWILQVRALWLLEGMAAQEKEAAALDRRHYSLDRSKPAIAANLRGSVLQGSPGPDAWNPAQRLAAISGNSPCLRRKLHRSSCWRPGSRKNCVPLAASLDAILDKAYPEYARPTSAAAGGLQGRAGESRKPLAEIPRAL